MLDGWTFVNQYSSFSIKYLLSYLKSLKDWFLAELASQPHGNLILLIVLRLSWNDEILAPSIWTLARIARLCMLIRMFHLSKLQPYGQNLCSTHKYMIFYGRISQIDGLEAGKITYEDPNLLVVRKFVKTTLTTYSIHS